MKALAAVAIALGLAVTSSASAQPRPLAEPVRIQEDRPPIIQLLSFGVGEVIFEKFGHAALCLRYHDPALEGVCFNYGVTDFAGGPGMVWRFLREDQKFWVEPSTFSDLIAFYAWEDRDIWIQNIPLSPAGARRLEAELWDSLHPDRRYYVYNHFFDNCTTKIRDMIDRAAEGRLRANSGKPFPLTFRELGQRGMVELPEVFGLTDFILGRQLDDHPTQWSSMFHPDLLRANVETKLGAEPELYRARVGPPFPTTGSSGRLNMFLLSLVFSIPLAIALFTRRFRRAALIWSTLYLAGWGLVIYTLAAISPIEGVRWNEAIFVLTPVDLCLPFLGPVRRRRYSQVRCAGLALVSLLCVFGIFHQPLWVPIMSAFIPLALLAAETTSPQTILANT
ncbi:MAG TPA: DUF4105 domain-containing protein [Kofleriaceae bacterium]